jgi:hypothetical protein
MSLKRIMNRTFRLAVLLKALKALKASKPKYKGVKRLQGRSKGMI